MFLGETSKDLDLEVYGVTEEQLLSALGNRFELDLVGRSFGVFKVKGLSIDISLPRRERRAGVGHKGFIVDTDPKMSIYEACERRDFTINSICYDPLTEEIIDPFNGEDAIKNKILTPTSNRFVEDPLRVLRGMQFIARFDLDPTAICISMCDGMTQDNLAKERLFEEWNKLILKGKDIAKGLNFLRKTNWLRYYPELLALIDCIQDVQWHPEGDVFVHTGHCMNAFALSRGGYSDAENLAVGYATLLHDVGKPKVTNFIEGRWRARGHNIAGEEPARTFMERLTNQEDLITEIIQYVIEHMTIDDIYDHSKSDAAIRRLANRIKSLHQLGRVVKNDKRGRPPIDSIVCPSVDWAYERAKQLAIESQKPKPIIKGRHLVAMGYTPGKEFKPILDALFEMQMDGKFTSEEDAVKSLKEYLKENKYDK